MGLPEGCQFQLEAFMQLRDVLLMSPALSQRVSLKAEKGNAE